MNIRRAIAVAFLSISIPLFCDSNIVSIEASLYEYPSCSDSFLNDEACEYTLPDLHGNALKLLHALIATGMVALSQDNYQKIVDLYFKKISKITPQNLSDLRTLIDSIAATNKLKKTKIRFIGDELGDRGSCDYYTLLVIKQLAKLAINYEIIISNHGFEFIQGYETGVYTPVNMLCPYASSLVSLGYFLSNHLVSKRDVKEIVESYYKPKLKVVSYTTAKDQNTITIYTHAPADLDQIRTLAKKFGVEYKDHTINDLTRTIDQINDVFQKQYVTTNLVHTIHNHLKDLMWNRDYAKLNRHNNHNGYHVEFVHGHDSGEMTSENIYNLDFENNLGKSRDNTTGKHQIFVS